MFVDDFIITVDSINFGQKVISKVSDLLASTGFHLTKCSASEKKF